jgi:DNA-binding PadR family transcriptional regulator
MNTQFSETNEGRERGFPGRWFFAALHAHQHGGCGEGRPVNPIGAQPYAEEEFAGPFAGPGEHGCGHGFGHRGHRGFGGRGGFEGGFGGRGRGFERGFGGGRGRMFDGGDVKLVVLKLLAEQPSYGYQLIKSMEERLSGGYSPSAGVIYPTLRLLEEEGLTTSATENNKKVYSVTAEGLAFLEANKIRVGELFERLEEVGEGFKRGRSPEIMKAFMSLRSAVMARMVRGNASPEQIRKIAEAIEAAVKAIDEL